MMKKRMVHICLLATALMLAGCSGSGANADQTTNAAKESTTADSVEDVTTAAGLEDNTHADDSKESKKSNKGDRAKSAALPQMVPITSIMNTRELGGYQTSDGRKVKMHKLIRSGELLKLSEEDIATLTNDYQLKVVLDLRSDAEIAEKPDPAIPGVTNQQIAILKQSTSIEPKNGVKQSEDPIGYLIGVVEAMGDVAENQKVNYVTFVTDDFAIQGFRQFFDAVLANKDGSILWHCTGGKDRTGMAAALLLEALGVDRETILTDYLLTNDYVKPLIDGSVAAASQVTTDQNILDGIVTLNGVLKEYMETSYDLIDQKYGSTAAFLEQEIGLTPEKQTQLKNLYLE